MKEIDKFQYISFDLYDTLLKRYVWRPKDIFRIVEEKGKEAFGEGFDHFSVDRVEAEREARKKLSEIAGCLKKNILSVKIANKEYQLRNDISKKDDVCEEVTLQDIYQCISSRYTEEEMEFAEKAELDAEYQYSTINQEILPAYRYAVERGKTILITTDIYLDEVFIRKVLAKIGVENYQYLYISSEAGYTKRSGKLYQKIVQDLDIGYDKLLHIGDNLHSDYEVPKRLGIHCIPIKTEDIHVTYLQKETDRLADNIAGKFINENILSKPVDERLGYECMGPLIYGFSAWLYTSLQKNNIRDVYFLARDGYILKKAFEIINEGEIRTHYLYASRRALQVPAIVSNPRFDSFISYMHWPKDVSIRYFLKSLGIEDQEYQDKIIEQQGLSQEFSIKRDKLREDKTFRRIFTDYSSRILENASREREALLGYLRQERFSGRVAIVDIGWHGNMQTHIESILETEHIDGEVFGYYIGVAPGDNHASEVSMQGYLFDDHKNPTIFKREKTINGMFEQIFMAPHGSTQRYEKKENRYVPVLYPNEQNDPASVKILQAYQRGALAFVRDFDGFLNKSDIKSDETFEREEEKKLNKGREKELAVKPLSEFFASNAVIRQFMYPTKRDAAIWKDVKFSDIENRNFIVSKGLAYYKRCPKDFIRDYHKSFWKEGFLQLTFAMRSDYHRVRMLLQGLNEMRNKFRR